MVYESRQDAQVERPLAAQGDRDRARQEVTKAALTSTCDALVLDARLRQSLVSVRALGQHGLRVAALETADAPSFASRWCQQALLCPAREGTDDYLAYLEQMLEQTGARVVISSSDGTIALLRQHRERLEQRVQLALAKEPALSIAVNKEQTLAIAQQLGLRIPRGVTVRALDEVADAVREIGLPAVVKPIESWVWGEQGERGARYMSRLVTTLHEARLAVEELTATGGTVLFQQFLTGRREAISFLYARGDIYARFAQWAKRTEPPLGGQSVLRQSIAIPTDIGGQAEMLVRAIELEGYSEVEFRRDNAGIPYLMEINPRLSASVEIAVRAGVDFPSLLYQWANGDRLEKTLTYRTGGWMRYLKGDLMTTIEAVQQRGRPGVTAPVPALFGFCLSFFMPMDYDYLDWNDPMPAWKASNAFLRSWVGNAVTRRLSRLRR